MRPNPTLKYLFTLSLFCSLLIACADTSKHTWQDLRKIAEDFFQRGIKSKTEGDQKNARRYFRKAIDVDSLFVEAYAEISQMQISGGEDRQAELFLTFAPAKVKREARILRLLGQAQFNQNKINEAILNIERSLKTDPSDKDAAWMLTQLYYKVENYELASLQIEALIHDSLLADKEKIVSLSEKIERKLRSRDSTISFEMNSMQKIKQASEVTRGQLALTLCYEFKHRLAFADTGIVFSDVKPDDAMLKYYKSAVACQVFEPLPDGKFYPYHIITRRNLAHYLYRIIMIKGFRDQLLPNDFLLTDVSPDDLQFEAIRVVCDLKLLTPQKGGYFGPDEYVAGKELTGSLKLLKAMLDAR